MSFANCTRDDVDADAAHLANEFSENGNSNVGAKIHRLTGPALMIFPQSFVFGLWRPMLVIAG
jgi:hypothetical protein